MRIFFGCWESNSAPCTCQADIVLYPWPKTEKGNKNCQYFSETILTAAIRHITSIQLVESPQIYIYAKPQSVTTFGKRIFVDVVSSRLGPCWVRLRVMFVGWLLFVRLFPPSNFKHHILLPSLSPSHCISYPKRLPYYQMFLETWNIVSLSLVLARPRKY